MKSTNEIISNLKKHQSSTPSKWRENAEWRIANKSWLRYSQHIAMMMLDKMDKSTFENDSRLDNLYLLGYSHYTNKMFDEDIRVNRED